MTPPLPSAISYVRRVNPSATIASSMSIRQVWTSLCGGSASMTSPSTATSGAPIERIASLASPRYVAPGFSSGSYSARPP